MIEEWNVMLQILAFCSGVILVLGPFGYAIFILKKLDAAAKLRKQAGNDKQIEAIRRGANPRQARKVVAASRETQFRFLIVDFFSLILLVQLPFNFVQFSRGDGISMVIIAISLVAVLLVWFTTIKTVSQAGINSFGWRALVSMVLIPTMYIGSFYVGPASLNLIWGTGSTKAVVWLVAALIGMILSWWIVKGALKAVSYTHLTLPTICSV